MQALQPKQAAHADRFEEGSATAEVEKGRAVSWSSLTFLVQCTLVSAALLLIAFAALAYWTSRNIEDSLKAHTANRVGNYLQGFAPMLQDMPDGKLSAHAIGDLDSILADEASRMGIEAVKIWSKDGTVLYATDKALIGRRLAVSSQLERAWRGGIELYFRNEPHADHDSPVINSTLLEVHVPLHDRQTRQVIAVVELYERAKDFSDRLDRVKADTGVVFASAGLAILSGMFIVLARSGRKIEADRDSLTIRLLRRSEERQVHAEAPPRSPTRIEFDLCRLGADLHDGPAQLMALGLMRLDLLFAKGKIQPEAHEYLKFLLTGALTEIRDISSGLALPEIESLMLPEALKLAVGRYEKCTSTTVSLQLFDCSIELDHPAKLCLTRFVQEGLSNAFRHANGNGQTVTVASVEDLIIVEVSDTGPSFDAISRSNTPSSLGLAGLRRRLESFGGYMTVRSAPGKGTSLTAYLPTTVQA